MSWFWRRFTVWIVSFTFGKSSVYCWRRALNTVRALSSRWMAPRRFEAAGLLLTERMPNSDVVELANGSIGYIPTRHAFAEGNYEPTCARCAPGSGEILAETAVNLLTELYERP